MGLMRFLVSPADRLTEELVDQVYLSGLDRVPWQVRAWAEGGELFLERKVSDSGNLHIPWNVSGHEPLVLSTATLIERAEPYHLPLELARGKLGQVRNQMAEWQTLGLVVPRELEATVAQATRCLSEAMGDDPRTPRPVERAEEALRLALDAAYLLSSEYAGQLRAVRRRGGNKLETLLGADLGSSLLDEYAADQYLQAFNAAQVPMVWREIEAKEGQYGWEVVDQQIAWCRAHRLAICAGPLLQLDPRTAPDWLYLCESDFDGLAELVCEFIEAAVARYRGAVDVWIAAGSANTAEAFSLSEEEQVRLTARSVETTRSSDPQADLVVSFDQPWGEYLRRRGRDLPPWHFADALLRVGLGLTGLALEINVDYAPGGTLPRDPLEFSRQMDYWGLLGVPLYVRLAVPSGSGPDPLASRRTARLSEAWTPQSQQSWIGRYVPVLLAKPSVRGVFWSQVRDSEPHAFPHGGLFDLRRHPKPGLRQLASIRQADLR